MRFPFFMFFILCVLGGRASGLPLQSITPSPPALTVVPDPQVRVSGSGTGLDEFPPTDPAGTPAITHAFTLRNDTTHPIVIEHLRAACGCTSLLLTSKKGAPVSTMTVMPGADAVVKMTVRLAGQEPGEMQKFAWVYGIDGVTLATLTIGTTIRPAYAFSPTYLNFGTVALGTARSMPVSITVDNSALKGGAMPVIVSSSPDLLLTPAGAPFAAMRDGVKSTCQKYQLTLAAFTPAGRLTATLALEPFTGPAMLAGHPTPPLLTAPVAASVTGHLTATPAMMFFGSVPDGQGSIRRALISAASDSSALRVASGSVWVSVRLLPPADAPPSMAALEVSLSPKTPAGPFQSSITVTDSSGEQLNLPVIALVAAAP